MTQSISRPIRAVLVLLSLLILLLALLVFNGWRFAGNSRALAISISESIFSNGSAESLVNNAHPAFIAEMNADSLQRYIDSVNRILGPLQSIDSIRGQVERSPLSLLSGRVAVEYELDLVFAQEPTVARVVMQRRGGQWLVRDYRIESTQLYN